MSHVRVHPCAPWHPQPALNDIINDVKFFTFALNLMAPLPRSTFSRLLCFTWHAKCLSAWHSTPRCWRREQIKNKNGGLNRIWKYIGSLQGWHFIFVYESWKKEAILMRRQRKSERGRGKCRRSGSARDYCIGISAIASEIGNGK